MLYTSIATALVFSIPVVIAQASSTGQATVTASAGSLPLGATCSSDSQCANGAQCWASNSMLIRACGNFNAACSGDSQCAFNACNNGLCNGALKSSMTATQTASVTIRPPPTISTASPSSLSLGATCSSDSECANGAQCWASNSMLIRRCGNFNAACTSSSQCAFNTCNTDSGLCTGIIAPSGNGTMTVKPTGGAGPTTTATPPHYTGGTSQMSSVMSAAASVMFCLIAWVL